MSIKEGKTYYLVSDRYEGASPMSRARVLINDDDEYGPFIVIIDDVGDWLWSGYVEEHELLTADQIIKLRDEHLMLVDAYERHG